MLLKYALKCLNVEVVTTRDSNSAVDTVKKIKPSLVVIDLNMPGLGGLEIAKILKSDKTTNSIPIFILSGTSKVEIIDKGYDLGINEYIVKPIRMNIFIDKVKNILKV